MTARSEQSVRITGDLTIYRAAELKGILDECVRSGKAADISGTGAVDTCGMQLFMAAKKSAAETGTPFSITGHTPEFIRMLDLYGLIRPFGDPVKISASLKKELSLSYSLSGHGGKS